MELVAAAGALFRERGYDATSIDDITSVANCSRRTFFRYFASKEDVAFGDAPERLKDLRRQLSASESADDRLATVCALLREHAIAFAEEPATRASVDLWSREPVLQRRLAEFVLSSEEALAAYLMAGGGSGRETRIVARVVAASLCGVVYVALRSGAQTPGAVDEALTIGFEIALEGARGWFPSSPTP
jgi:AcrR family transcriptional regulator